MRKQDVEVREVVCSETGKPMPKIPLWMADVRVKFVSDEARQKHPTTSLADLEPLRRHVSIGGDLEEIKEVIPDLDDADAEEEVTEEEPAEEFEE